MPAKTPSAPYYSVTLTTIVSPGTLDIITKLIAFIKESTPGARGFLGMESAKGEKDWITATYWTDMASINDWIASLKGFAAKHPSVMMAVVSSKARIAKVESDFP